jgi:hypothetical protein
MSTYLGCPIGYPGWLSFFHKSCTLVSSSNTSKTWSRNRNGLTPHSKSFTLCSTVSTQAGTAPTTKRRPLLIRSRNHRDAETPPFASCAHICLPEIQQYIW